MGREVAIKILRGDRAVDDSAKARFMREARANSLLASPNTVTVFDFGQSSNGEFYLAMELLEGESLGARITRVGRVPAPLAVDACRQALRSLGEAHAKGIIHRDLKPDNLFFARVLTSSTESAAGDDTQAHDEIVKVLDFGIAKMIDEGDQNPMSVVETQAGTVFGTPRYMSPEQAQGKPVDRRADLYALGAIAYRCLTGTQPYQAPDTPGMLYAVVHRRPVRPGAIAELPGDVDRWCAIALAKSPADRFPTGRALADALSDALRGALSEEHRKRADALIRKHGWGG
jgi:serine/threonine protein kinase